MRKISRLQTQIRGIGNARPPLSVEPPDLWITFIPNRTLIGNQEQIFGASGTTPPGIRNKGSGYQEYTRTPTH
jgi:hypothetical protein